MDSASIHLRPHGTNAKRAGAVAHDSNRLRDRRAGIGARAVLRPAPRHCTPAPLERDACRRRTQIERSLANPKHVRAIAPRYDKH